MLVLPWNPETHGLSQDFVTKTSLEQMRVRQYIRLFCAARYVNLLVTLLLSVRVGGAAVCAEACLRA